MNLEQARTNMVEQQIRTWEVLDQEVLDLLYVIPREEFVPQQHRALAFSDLELPLEEGTKAGEGERMWQPKLEARVLQELALKRTDRVLEVGTGSGYLTALMAHRAAEVCSVDIRATLAAFGRANLERHGTDNIVLEIGDAARGWARRAPYDAIVLTGSTPILPQAFLDQLAPGGRLFAVVGEAPAMQARLVTSTAMKVKAGIVTGELTDMKVTERVEDGTDRIAEPAKLTGKLSLKNTSSDQTMRLVGGKISYIDMQGKPIAMEDNRTAPIIQVGSGYGSSDRLDPGHSSSQTLDAEFPAAALKAKNLKEVRLELAFIPPQFREGTLT